LTLYDDFGQIFKIPEGVRAEVSFLKDKKHKANYYQVVDQFGTAANGVIYFNNVKISS